MGGAITGFRLAVLSGAAGAALIVGGLLVGGTLAGAQEPPTSPTPGQSQPADPGQQTPSERPRGPGGGQHDGMDCPKDQMEGESSPSGAGFRGGRSLPY
jgi:hypothetical protein